MMKPENSGNKKIKEKAAIYDAKGAVFALIISSFVFVTMVPTSIDAFQNNQPAFIWVPVLLLFIMAWSTVKIANKIKKKSISSFNNRPPAVTIIFGFLLLMHGSGMVFVPFLYRLFSPIDYIYLNIMNILLFASIIGILKLKKWSIYSYPTIFIANITRYAIFPFEASNDLIPNNIFIGQVVMIGIIIIILYKHRNRFT